MKHSAIRPSVVLTLALTAVPFSCVPADRPSARGTGEPEGQGQPIELFDGRTIPAMPELLGMRAQYELRLDWLEQKHALLLDQMREHDIEMWIVVSEEFHPDAVTQYVTPGLL